MASKKHQKQDSTRPTKARSRRMRAQPNGEEFELGAEERPLEPLSTNAQGVVDG